MRVLAIGEMLWDIFPQQELLGGAALNVCANLERMGDTARLITAVGDDERGHRALMLMDTLGLDTQFVQTATEAATGTAVVSHDATGEPSFTVSRPAAYDHVSLCDAEWAAIASYAPHCIYFGTLFHTTAQNEDLTSAILRAAPGAHILYDMNLRPGQWDIALVRRLCTLCSVLKLNEHEVRILAAAQNMQPGVPLERFARHISETFSIPTICVTLGPAGCFVYDRGTTVSVPGIPIQVKDTVGAGDAFASAFIHGYQSGLSISDTARLANSAGAIVASHHGATPPWTMEELQAACAVALH